MQTALTLLFDAIADPAVLAGTALTSVALLSGAAARIAEWVARHV